MALYKLSEIAKGGRSLSVPSPLPKGAARYAVTVDGSLVLDPSAVGTAVLNNSGSLTVASGGTLTTESAVSNSFIDVPVTNQVGGTVTITQSAVNVEELLGKFIFSAATLASPKTPAPEAPK